MMWRLAPRTELGSDGIVTVVHRPRPIPAGLNPALSKKLPVVNCSALRADREEVVVFESVNLTWDDPFWRTVEAHLRLDEGGVLSRRMKRFCPPLAAGCSGEVVVSVPSPVQPLSEIKKTSTVLMNVKRRVLGAIKLALRLHEEHGAVLSQFHRNTLGMLNSGDIVVMEPTAVRFYDHVERSDAPDDARIREAIAAVNGVSVRDVEQLWSEAWFPGGRATPRMFGLKLGMLLRSALNDAELDQACLTKVLRRPNVLRFEWLTPLQLVGEVEACFQNRKRPSAVVERTTANVPVQEAETDCVLVAPLKKSLQLRAPLEQSAPVRCHFGKPLTNEHEDVGTCCSSSVDGDPCMRPVQSSWCANPHGWSGGRPITNPLKKPRVVTEDERLLERRRCDWISGLLVLLLHTLDPEDSSRDLMIVSLLKRPTVTKSLEVYAAALGGDSKRGAHPFPELEAWCWEPRSHGNTEMNGVGTFVVEFMDSDLEDLSDKLTLDECMARMVQLAAFGFKTLTRS
ncbi:unnamed protein product [Durusdinium trenchii]|uniref:Inositol-pentakisphosphate 2-kinase n=1 Tax=Durusdinium trenchii TaxID=1381693 RepID=A0ABP0RHE5_9DINO